MHRPTRRRRLTPTAPKIEQAIQAAGPSDVLIRRAETMAQAVAEAKKAAQPGDVVLLSPAAPVMICLPTTSNARAFIDAVNAPYYH